MPKNVSNTSALVSNNGSISAVDTWQVGSKVPYLSAELGGVVPTGEIMSLVETYIDDNVSPPVLKVINSSTNSYDTIGGLSAEQIAKLDNAIVDASPTSIGATSVPTVTPGATYTLENSTYAGLGGLNNGQWVWVVAPPSGSATLSHAANVSGDGEFPFLTNDGGPLTIEDTDTGVYIFKRVGTSIRIIGRRTRQEVLTLISAGSDNNLYPDTDKAKVDNLPADTVNELAGAVKTANNLSDVNPASARENLSVYSRAEVDGAISAGTTGSLEYLGNWNADTNTPPIPAAAPGNRGHFYSVEVAGATTIDGITDWAVGEEIRSNGTVWEKKAARDAVSSVNGQVGAVALTKADVGLGNVDNTPDTAKPVSAAQQAAIDAAVTGQITPAERAKLAAIEANATADQSGADIKGLLEAEADTNTLTDAQVALVGSAIQPADLERIPNGVDATEVAISDGTVVVTRATHLLAAETGTSDNVTGLDVSAMPALSGGTLIIKAGLTISFTPGAGLVTVTGGTVTATSGDVVDWQRNESGNGVIISKRGAADSVRSILGGQTSVANATTELVARYGSEASAPIGATFVLNDASDLNHNRVFFWVGSSWMPSSPSSKLERYVFAGGGAGPSYYLLNSELLDADHASIEVGGAVVTGFTYERGDWTADAGGAQTRIVDSANGGGNEVGNWVASATGDDVRLSFEVGDVVTASETVVIQAFEGLTSIDGAGGGDPTALTESGGNLTGPLIITSGEIVSTHLVETVGVGPGGDYADFQTAFDAESQRHRPPRTNVVLLATAGFNPLTGLVAQGGDFSRFRIESEDPILLLDSEFSISDAPFIRATNCVGAPVLACLVDANGRTSKGYDLYGSHGTVLPGCGITNFYGSGLHATESSTCNAVETIWDDGVTNSSTGHAVAALKGSSVCIDGSSAQRSGYYGIQAAWGGSLSASNRVGVGAVNVSGAFRYGLRVTDGGIIAADAITAQNCGQGSGVGNAVRVHNQGSIMCRDADFSGCNGQSPISCSGAGANVHAQGANLSGNLSPDDAVCTQGGLVVVTGATADTATIAASSTVQSGGRIIDIDGSVIS